MTFVPCGLMPSLGGTVVRDKLSQVTILLDNDFSISRGVHASPCVRPIFGPNAELASALIF